MQASRTICALAAALLALCGATVASARAPAPVPCQPVEHLWDPEGEAVFVFSTSACETRAGEPELTPDRARIPFYGLALHDRGAWRMAIGDEQSWLAGLHDATRGRPPRVLVYIHGFNNGPDLAFERARRIAGNAGFAGPVVALVWPSKRSPSPLAYPVDEATNEWSRAFVAPVLASLAHDGFEVVLVAHSMGNRIALDALSRLDERNPALADKVRTVVLASPDVDSGMFDRDAAALLAKGHVITVYASQRDRALATSNNVHSYRRTGNLNCSISVVAIALASGERCYPQTGAPGLSVVDTTEVRSDAVGHSDFIDSAAASADLCRVVRGLPTPTRVPGDRPGLYLLKTRIDDRRDCPNTSQSGLASVAKPDPSSVRLPGQPPDRPAAWLPRPHLPSWLKWPSIRR